MSSSAARLDPLGVVADHAVGDAGAAVVAGEGEAPVPQALHQQHHVARHRPLRVALVVLAVGRGRAVAVAAKVGGDHREALRQRGGDAVPAGAGLGVPVQQEQGRARARRLVGDRRLADVLRALPEALDHAADPLTGGTRRGRAPLRPRRRVRAASGGAPPAPWRPGCPPAGGRRCPRTPRGRSSCPRVRSRIVKPKRPRLLVLTLPIALPAAAGREALDVDLDLAQRRRRPALAGEPGALAHPEPPGPEPDLPRADLAAVDDPHPFRGAATGCGATGRT